MMKSVDVDVENLLALLHRLSANMKLHIHTCIYVIIKVEISFLFCSIKDTCTEYNMYVHDVTILFIYFDTSHPIKNLS